MPDTRTEAQVNAAQLSDWKHWLAKQGFNAVLLVATLAFVAHQILIPQREDQHEFMKSVMETNKMYAEAAAKQAVAEQSQARAAEENADILDAILGTQKELIQVNKTIMEEQRQGIWRKNGDKP